MFDYYSYLNGEIRNLAFFKSSKPSTWQDAVKQKQASDIETRLTTFISPSWLDAFSKAISFPFDQWRRVHSQAPGLVTNLLSHKAG